MTATDLRVELVGEVTEAGGGRQYAAWASGRFLGRVRAVPDQGWLRVAVDDTVALSGSAERRAVLDGVAGLAASEQAYEQTVGVVLVAGTHLLLRHDARAAGFTGPLRADLSRRRPAPDVGPRPSPEHRAGSTEEPETDRFFSELGSLLPGVVVAPARRAGLLRTLVRSASSGVNNVVHLTAGDAADRPPLAVSVPLDADVMAEGVALAIDTALSLRRRFRPLVDRVRIFYDQSIQGLRTGLVAGAAEQSARDVHLNPAYALVGEMEALERQLAQPPSPGGLPRKSRTVRPPFTRIDSVVAHEYGHHIEFGFENSRYRDSVEFRRAIGGYFGVETLEHVIKGKGADAPESWQAAHARLVEQVSSYAATNPQEATAELFKQWWCTAADPPPSARAFGAIVARFFPAP